MAQLLDGNHVAALLRTRIASRASALPRPPGLATVLVGEHAPSRLYLRLKRRACRSVGFESYKHDLPANTSQAALLELIDALNQAPEVHGVLVQLPLPAHINTRVVIEAISPAKDVDGFHPLNIGYLQAGLAGFTPCTPAGIMALLDYYGLSCAGKDAVVIGRSTIVGRPLATMLTASDATVTLCHASTCNLEQHVRRAEILVSAVGQPGLFPGEWVREGSWVIIVGQRNLPEGRLAGDVDHESASARAAWVTPVPGGVGPMTVTMLLANTLQAACQLE